MAPWCGRGTKRHLPPHCNEPTQNGMALWHPHLLLHPLHQLTHLFITRACWGLSCSVPLPACLGHGVLARRTFLFFCTSLAQGKAHWALAWSWLGFLTLLFVWIFKASRIAGSTLPPFASHPAATSRPCGTSNKRQCHFPTEPHGSHLCPGVFLHLAPGGTKQASNKLLLAHILTCHFSNPSEFIQILFPVITSHAQLGC